MLELNNVDVCYDNRKVVDDLSFRIDQGDIGVLLGPSGCSKTTILRVIAGFIPLSGGDISIDGQCVSSVKVSAPPENRSVGMVFQDFALFPHLNVFDNISFGIRHWSIEKRNERVNKLLSLIQMEELADRFPHELSGGQQQRIALIRALAPKPKLILMDEPFSNIDVEFREKLATKVAQLLKEEQITALIVTHDQNEAFLLADVIGVIRQGRLQQWDAGYRIYHQPINRFVAEFIGQGVFLPGTISEDGHIVTELSIINGEIPPELASGDQVDVLIRPDDILLDKSSRLKGVITHRVFRGASYLYTLMLPSSRCVLSLQHSHHQLEIGEELGISLHIAHTVIFGKDSTD